MYTVLIACIFIVIDMEIQLLFLFTDDFLCVVSSRYLALFILFLWKCIICS